MDRKHVTGLLGETLVRTRLSGMGKYYAKEVTVGYGTSRQKRVDFLQFEPPGSIFVSDIEKGIFISYEVKSCLDDVYSGNGLNFIGEKNYIVTTMETYKLLQPDIRSGKLRRHIKECNPESSMYFGVMVLMPEGHRLDDEYKSPTALMPGAGTQWTLYTVMPCTQGPRTHPVSELLFCMLRSGK